MLPAIVASQIINSRTGKSPAQMPQQILGKVGHKEREADGVFHTSLFDAHEILQTEVLLGLSESKLDLEPQRIIVDEGRGLQSKIAAKQHHMTKTPARHVGLYQNNDVESLCKILVQAAHLIHIGSIALLRVAKTVLRLGQTGIVEAV